MAEEHPHAPAQGATPAASRPEPPALTALLLETFPQGVLGHHTQYGDETVILSPEVARAAFAFLKSDSRCRFDLMIDLTAVDYLPRQPRFEVVVHLKSTTLHHRLRVKVPVSEEKAEVETISDLWVAANWYERECWDMYGIRFRGHPDLRRLLMYEEFVGHPLRKDYDYSLQQPRVPLRVVRERYDYENKVLTPADRERLQS